MNQYGPAALLGVLIGGAIMLDDVVTPQHPHAKMMFKTHGMESMSEIHHRAHEAAVRIAMRTDIGADDSDKPLTQMWVQKGGDDNIELIEDMEVIVLTEDGDEAEDVTTIKVQVDGSATAGLGETVKAMVDKARAEGRKPTPEELKRAVMDALSDSKQPAAIDIDVQVDESS